jgi:hypothetical protein
MKNSIFILVILTLISCRFNNKSFNKTDICNDTLQKSYLDSISNILIGEWGIYSTIYYTKHDSVIDEMSSNCNVCPKIIFHIDNSAIVNNPSGSIEKLLWKINKDKLIILSTSKIDSVKTFSDTVYIMLFTKDNKFFELKLTQLKNKYSFILRR